ncbi:FixH family protein [Chitinimonas sp.]|uniref:FixH family protein n=1 Tax=Chitinimonas sp. TaxID=1934313 RepID=UPI0035AFB45E
MSNAQAAGWQKQPILWLFIGLLVVTVLACIWLFWIAAKTNDGLVSDHYYEDGKAISQEVKQDQLAASLGLSAQIMIGNDGQAVHVLMMPTTQQPDVLKLRFAHPTRSGKDQQVQMRRDGSGMYVAQLPEKLAAQRWLMQIEAQGWRLQSEAIVGPGGAVIARPMVR